ncbi:hypothetical protein PHPALM_29846, partial [Phytophthora palmivora]
MVGPMHRLKNKLRSSRLHKKEGAWALDEDSLRLKQQQDDAVRFDRSTTLADTVNVTDDVEEMFYGRSTTRSTTSDVPQYRTTEQIRGNTGTMTLSALQEDTEASYVSNVSSSFSQFSATTPSNYAASTPGNNLTSTYHGFSTTQNARTAREDVELERLRSEVLEVKEEVKAIRREVMNELHVTRYD